MASIFGLGRSSSEKAAAASRSSALAQQSDLAKQINAVGGAKYSLTAPAYGKSLDYYTSLLGGDRSKALQAVSPDIRRITDSYRGSMSSLDRSLRGPAHDQALADLARQKAADISALTGAPRQNAAGVLLGEGNNAFGQYMQGAGASANIFGNQAAAYSDIVAQEQARRRAIMENFASMGGSLAKLFAPYLLGAGGTAASGMSLPTTKLPAFKAPR